MKYSDIVKKDKTLIIETENGKMTVVYDQTFFSRDNSIFKKPDWEQMLDIDFAIYCFCHGLLVSWDLQADNDKIIPFSEKDLGKLNKDFLVELYKILQEDAKSFFRKH